MATAFPYENATSGAAAREEITRLLRRRKPTTYFVNSMGDLFHENVPDAWIDRVFAVMALTPQHTYQVLTKRAGRLLDGVEHNGMPDMRRAG